MCLRKRWVRKECDSSSGTETTSSVPGANLTVWWEVDAGGLEVEGEGCGGRVFEGEGRACVNEAPRPPPRLGADSSRPDQVVEPVVAARVGMLAGVGAVSAGPFNGTM